MAYADLNTISNPSTGAVAPAAWGDQVRDNDEFLINPPSCNAFNSTAQSINNATTTVLTANSEVFDNFAMHSTVTNTSRITCQLAGTYDVFARYRFAVNATGIRILDLLLNGTTNTTMLAVDATSTTDTVLTTIKSYQLAVGDFVECRAHQTSGGALNVTLEEFTARFRTR